MCSHSYVNRNIKLTSILSYLWHVGCDTFTSNVIRTYKY